MVSLPVGGMITRIAWGSTIRRMICSRPMPSDEAASVWPSLTERIPARTISAMYAPSLSPKPRIAATKKVIRELAFRWMNDGPNGTPKSIRGYTAAMKPQNSS